MFVTSHLYKSSLVCFIISVSFPMFASKQSFSVSGDDSTKRNIIKRVYHTTRIQSPKPVIDGKLDDICWKEGQWTGDYKQHIPDEGAEPSQNTQFKLMYDDNNIYVAIRAFDNDPDKIDRQMGRRDDFSGDIVGVCFDSYYDYRTGFEFDLTAAGSKIDLILLNDRWDTSWDAVWHGKTGFEDSAWVAEMQIPLSQLRYGDKKEHVWGLHAWRWINRNQEEVQWNLIPRDNPGYLYSIGELHGIKNIPTSRRIEILPYILGKRHSYLPEDNNPFSDGTDYSFELGLDGKIGITSDFTLDVTINPDFGQVEADPSELNLTAFETYFVEKRPFFLEGKNILDFDFGPGNLFYSRRIGHKPTYVPELGEDEFSKIPESTSILGAMKLTGKSKSGLSVGIVESITSKETATIDKSGDKTEKTAEPLTNFFVARVQKDINKSNTIIGGMLTHTRRNLKDDHLRFMNTGALTGGLDLRHHISNKTYYIDAKTVFSQVSGHQEAITNLQEASARYYQRPNASHLHVDTTLNSLAGHGGSIEFGKSSQGKFRFELEFEWGSPGLELNDLGYLTKTDYLTQTAEFGYVDTEPKSLLREFTVWTAIEQQWDFSGQLLARYAFLMVQSKFKNKWNFQARTLRHGKEYDRNKLRGGPAIWTKPYWCNFYNIRTDDSKDISFHFNHHFHIFDDKISYIHDFTPGFSWKITNFLRLNTSVSYSDHKRYLYYIPAVEIEDDLKYLLGTLKRKTLGITFRMDFSLSPELSIQYYANPYTSAGTYEDFKKVTDHTSKNYNNLFYTYQEKDITRNEANNTILLKDQSGEITIDNPDFNFRQLRSNFVLRWEYKPGSTLYAVWTHGRSGYENVTNMSLNENMQNMFDIFPDNVFLIKFNYWMSI